jgi:raffinose/stachyose/melibiose transport system permease protein
MTAFSRAIRATSVVPLLLASLFVLYPLGVMVLESFKNQGQIFADPLGLPSTLSFDNYSQAWAKASFSDYFLNSIIVTTGAVALSLGACSMASYVLARYTSRWLDGMYIGLVLGLVLPIRLIVVSLLVILRALDLLDSLLGLILVYSTTCLPFSTFVLTNYMRALPRELDDAARADGASDFSIYRLIIMPLSRPGLAVVAIYDLVYVWNDYFLPLIFVRSPDLRTLPLGVTIFFSEYSTRWDLVFASLTTTSLPVLLCFVVLSRQFISGIIQGALK